MRLFELIQKVVVIQDRPWFTVDRGVAQLEDSPHLPISCYQADGSRSSEDVTESICALPLANYDTSEGIISVHITQSSFLAHLLSLKVISAFHPR